MKKSNKTKTGKFISDMLILRNVFYQYINTSITWFLKTKLQSSSKDVHAFLSSLLSLCKTCITKHNSLSKYISFL